MLGLKPLLLAALCAVATTAESVIDKRQGTASLGTLTCGTNTYTRQQVDEATAEGCRLHAAGRTLGNGNYPHPFRNFEGLEFATNGPYQEFPILKSGNYTGGSPGADRIAFDPNFRGSCVYVGGMTHTGAVSRNGFVSCSERSDPRPSASPTTSRPASSSSSTTSASHSASTSSGANPRSLVSLGGGGLVALVLAQVL